MEVPQGAMEFAYDHSRLRRPGEVVAWADFCVGRDDPGRLREIARQSLRIRKQTQPLPLPSAGCIFQNPDATREPLPAGLPASAGALIDRAGLKGARQGGALVSPTHANFITAASESMAPGILADDARDLYRVMQKVMEKAKGDSEVDVLSDRL